MSEAPAPLVPADVDLRGLPFMPLYGDRLFKSETWKKANWEARCAMVRLWWHAFAHEVPAGSLPDDDTLLADYAGYGDAVKPWLKVRDQALRHWIKCSDGRFYDPVTAEIAMQAWEGRLSASAKGRAGASMRWGKRGHEKPLAQASPDDGAGNAQAKEKNGKRQGEGSDSDKKKKPKGAAVAMSFPTPDWIPKVQWDAWIEARASKGKSPTEFALSLAVAKLDDLRSQGHAPAAVLAQSAFNGWTDLYPVKAAAR